MGFCVPLSMERPINRVCVFCAAADGARPEYLQAASDLGKLLVDQGIELVYGGGGRGLMGAVAESVLARGGKAVGVITRFLVDKELAHKRLTALHVVHTMHERKMMMYERSDAFVVLPGGIGTLEEIVELLSWRRLDLHQKPIVFHNPGGFWNPFFELIRHTIDARLTPPSLASAWRAVEKAEDVTPAVQAWDDEIFQAGAPATLRPLT